LHSFLTGTAGVFDTSALPNATNYYSYQVSFPATLFNPTNVPVQVQLDNVTDADVNNDLVAAITIANGDEIYVGGTFVSLSIEPAPAGQVRVFWSSVAGAGYQLYSAPSASGPWTLVGPGTAEPNGENDVFLTPNLDAEYFSLQSQ
jgi:hypothetical protein